jgi:hypothetical protein
MVRPSRVLPLAALFLAFAAGAPVRAADDYEEARKEFRKALRAEEPKARAGAFLRIAGQDRPEAADEIIQAMLREKSSQVLLSAIRTISRFEKPETRAYLAAQVRSRTGAMKYYLLLSIADQRGVPDKELLLELVRGKDAQAAALAALALGKHAVAEAAPDLRALLASDDWHLRSAGARALKALGPAAGVPESLPALAEALAKSEGRERGDILDALETLSGQKMGFDPEAWKKVAAGAKVAEVGANPVSPPYVCGHPIWGRRVVIVVDNSVRMDDAHPFGDKDRLKAVSEVPGARPVPWYELRTIRDFVYAHARRLISDLPSGTSFEVVSVSTKARPAFGRLSPANGGTKKVAADLLGAQKAETAHDDYSALTHALDLSGKKDSVAWSLGPDEVVYLTCQGPWHVEVADPDEIAAEIGLKARLRLVPIHTIGVGEHPYGYLQQLSEISGGTYVNLSK